MTDDKARKMLAVSVADLLAGHWNANGGDSTKDDWRDEAEAIARCFTPHGVDSAGQPVFRFHGPAGLSLWDSELGQEVDHAE